MNMEGNHSENPYVGPRPFDLATKEYYFGREEEAKKLFYLVRANQLVLFYAQSGAGKSSLIQAKLIPNLEDNEWFVFPVGRLLSGETTKLEDKRDSTFVDDGINPFIHNLIQSLLPKDIENKTLEVTLKSMNRRTLGDFLNCSTYHEAEETGKIQFEVDLARFNGEYPIEQPHPYLAKEDEIVNKVLIIDQFEELLTTNLMYWKKREDFFKQLDDAIKIDPGLHVVLVVREEYVPSLIPYVDVIEGGIRPRFYMQLLDHKAALMAIENPAKLKGRCYNEKASKKLRDDLSSIQVPGKSFSYPGEFIDPVLLQIVCCQIWEKIVDKGINNITEDDIGGDDYIQPALEDYYDKAIKYAVDQTAIEEKFLRDWFEKTLTTNGVRNIIRQEQEITADLPNDVVRRLEERYILRPVYHSGVGTMFELAHDRLINPILESNRKWQVAHPDKNELPKFVRDNLHLLKQTHKGNQVSTDRIIKIPVFIKEPYLALENPSLGVQEIAVRLEAGMRDGPTSSRVAVVDFDNDTQTTAESVVWDQEVGWFRSPGPEGEWLPYAIDEPSLSGKIDRRFIEKLMGNRYFRQVNVWAVVQRVLEFYEAPQALGRPIPWGFNDNRLLVVPHAGYMENAFYDRESKSLQFYYFGDQENPKYTCLSHDIIAHETGKAVLDGIRPLNFQVPSVQAAALYEFIGDLTAILIALFNDVTLQFVAGKMDGKLGEADILANFAVEFAREVEGREYLRTAFNQYSLGDAEIRDSISPHTISQVMTGAMWDILEGMVARRLRMNWLGPIDGAEEASSEENEEVSSYTEEGQNEQSGEGKPVQALRWAAEQFRRIALQPLDFCPPCDIQFVDYAKAVIRNDIITNPEDKHACRQIMLDVFHRRGLCNCGYQPDKDMPEECDFQSVMKVEKVSFVYHDIERLSSSRTAAYYFLSYNRDLLRIPAHQDVRVVDLYDVNKMDVNGKWLPRETVLEYAWQEEVILANDPQANLEFGQWNGKTGNLDCGGTLVFDDRGNLLSWSRKPGTEHMAVDEAQDTQRCLAAWQIDPAAAKEQWIIKPTRLELAKLADLDTGRQRKADLLAYMAVLIKRGVPPVSRRQDE